MAVKKTRSPVIKNDPFEEIEETASKENSDLSSAPAAPKAKAKPKTKAKPKAKPKSKSNVEVEVVPQPAMESVMATEVSSASNQINLGSSLGIQEVAQVLAEIKTAFDLGSPVELNGGDVERVDGAGLQLLCMLIKTGGEQEVSVSWQSASETLIDGAKQLGLQDLLQMKESEHTT
ncbi:MAG: STAS domain-containing protein [Candidatus Polarisedimenticolaceae bacterium]|nr:STAS domain-containing protein [Candidatus Polarisedimenticolaceae bacterium]